ncbi:MAG: endonuclease/exonuclease/phosphatase family protein [Chitinophagaceae bacterium]
MLRILILILLSLQANASIRFCAWNIANLGQSKSAAEIQVMAETLRDFDIVGIEEVVAGYGGAPAVARLVDALNRTGSKWDYRISDPTSQSIGSHKQERYAFLWKTAKVNMLGRPFLEPNYQADIEREPFVGVFQAQQKTFRVFIFHAITKSQQPEREIKFFKFLPELYPQYPIIFAGDFNCPEDHTVFNPLKKQGYTPSMVNQKTSLKMTCINGDCLASEFDHIFFKPTEFKVIRKGIVPFYEKLPNFDMARAVSDHVPVFIEFE